MKSFSIRFASVLLAFSSLGMFTARQAAPAAQQGPGKLADLYRTGRVRLVAEFHLDSKNLPQGFLPRTVSDLAMDSRGDIYVLDQLDNNIKKFDRNGKPLKVLGRCGQGPGEFQSPNCLAVAGDELVVYNISNMRLSCLDLDGSFITDIPRKDLSIIVRRIMGLPDGRIVIDDEKYHYDRPDKPQDIRIYILGRETKPDRTIFERPVLRTRLVKLPRGAMTGYSIPFGPDIIWDVSPTGRVVVGLSDKYELELYDPDGSRTGLISRAWTPARITGEERKVILGSHKFYDSSGNVMTAPDDILKARIFPDHKPAFDHVHFDREDNILVQPVTGTSLPCVYDAFSPDGQFISRVEFYGTGREFTGITKQAPDGSILSADMDNDGEWTITKWRIAD